jgi:hypothetical protein
MDLILTPVPYTEQGITRCKYGALICLLNVPGDQIHVYMAWPENKKGIREGFGLGSWYDPVIVYFSLSCATDSAKRGRPVVRY